MNYTSVQKKKTTYLASAVHATGYDVSECNEDHAEKCITNVAGRTLMSLPKHITYENRESSANAEIEAVYVICILSFILHLG